MSSPNHSAVCQSCFSGQVESFFKISRMPVDCGTLSRKYDEAKLATVGEIDLYFCHGCGLVFNQSFDPSLIGFGNDYEVSLNCSGIFSQFQLATAQRLAEKYLLKGKTVFEIGCGNGEFLKSICRIANCAGIGIDPSVKSTQINVNDQQIIFRQSIFDESYFNAVGDFVCCLSVFEDIRHPAAFLHHLHNRLDKQQPAYFETFNGMRAMEQGEVWSVHYEQCNYFSVASLQNAITQNGFQILDHGTCYQGDQYLFVEFEPCQKPRAKIDLDQVRRTFEIAKEFGAAFANRKLYWTRRLGSYAPGKVVFWGSGGKAITFFNSVPNSDRIQTVVDNNKLRQGKFLPVTGQKVSAPDKLKEEQPELIIVSNRIYAEEIGQQVCELGIFNAQGDSPPIEVA